MSKSAVRDPVIDAARGFALLGILIGNLSFFAMPGGVAGEWWRQTRPGWTDWAAAMLIRAACENTFILIFSFLFGYGAARQIGSSGQPRFLRRCLGLAAIGILHALLFWAGDILLAYGLIGLLLPFAVRWPMERIFRAGLLLWVTAVLGNTLVGAGLVILRPPLPDPAAAIALYKSGDLAGIFMVRFAEWAEFYGFGLIVLFPLVGAACLLGIAAERWLAGRPPSALVELAPDLTRWLVWPAMAGSIAYGLLAVTPRSVADGVLLAPEIILRAVFSPLGALVLLVASIRLFASPASTWLREWFRINGQLSLSIYVGQSIACVLLFHGYGLGLYASIGPFGSLMAAVALFAAMTLSAGAWQRLFGWGPLERLLVHRSKRRHQPEFGEIDAKQK
jgi:uncharacterized protein